MKTMLCLFLLFLGVGSMCGGSSKSSGIGSGGASFSSPNRGSANTLSGTRGLSLGVSVNTGNPNTLSGTRGLSLGSGGVLSGKGQSDTVDTTSLGGEMAPAAAQPATEAAFAPVVQDAPAPPSATVVEAARDVDRARAAIDGTVDLFGDVGVLDDTGLTLGGPVTEAGTLTNQATNVQMTDDETFMEAFGRKLSNPLESSTLGKVGQGVGLLANVAGVSIPGIGFVGEALDAAINPEKINMAGPGGRYHWSKDAYIREPSANRPAEHPDLLPVTSTGGVVKQANKATTTADATKATSTSSTVRARRTQNSTIATSVFGDMGEASILRRVLGGK